MSKNKSAFTLSCRDDGIAILTMDVPGESMNTLKAEFAEQIAEQLDQIDKDPAIKGLVIASGKASSFVAGADISMLAACQSAEDAEELSRSGQQMFQRIENMKIPVVAAIHGPALGGGLELALCCHYRICSDDDKTAMGLPEVQLGLLPGSGGTQRLPKLIGIQKAMTMMLTGKQLRPKQAKRDALVDEVVPLSILMDVAVQFAKNASQPGKARN